MNAKRIREDRGLSQERLAREANVSLGTVRNLERGQNIRSDMARAIARALGVPIDDLFEQQSA